MKKSDTEIKRLMEKFPSVPAFAILRTKSKKSSPTNQLTSDIKDYCKSIGAFCFRYNSQGNYSQKLGKFIQSGSERGASDLLICYKSKLYCCELKIGKDKQRPEQVIFQSKIQQAGGNYFICSSLESFKIQFDTIINK